MALHWYGGVTASTFLAHVDAVWLKYGKPIWITEFASADWSSTTGGYDVTKVKAFIKAACAGLDQRSYVERYTWKSRPTSDQQMGTSGLWNDDSTLTELG